MKQRADRAPSGITWLGKIKLRVLVAVIGVPLAVAGVVSLGPGWLMVPLVGVAVAAVTVTVNKITQRLGAATCWTCGQDLSSEPEGEHGIVCPECGSLCQARPRWLASSEGEQAESDTDERA